MSQVKSDIDAYIDSLPEDEQQEVAIAGVALDLAAILYHARQERGLSQTAVANKAGLRQQSVSRLEKAVGVVQLGTLQKYLGALGYTIDITVKDTATGEIVGQTTLAS